MADAPNPTPPGACVQQNGDLDKKKAQGGDNGAKTVACALLLGYYIFVQRDNPVVTVIVQLQLHQLYTKLRMHVHVSVDVVDAPSTGLRNGTSLTASFTAKSNVWIQHLIERLKFKYRSASRAKLGSLSDVPEKTSVSGLSLSLSITAAVIIAS